MFANTAGIARDGASLADHDATKSRVTEQVTRSAMRVRRAIAVPASLPRLPRARRRTGR
jgi:hypothetical protein